MVRPTGQRSPRPCNRRAPATYSPTATTAMINIIQLISHTVTSARAVNGGGSG